jgi:serine protease Do
MKTFSLKFVGLTLSALLTAACSQASSTDGTAATSSAATAVVAAAAPAAGPAVNYGASLPDFTGLVDRYGKAVVNVSVVEKLQPAVDFNGPNLSPDDPFYDFFKRFRGVPRGQQQPSRGIGSGFIISPDGYILTNAHVVDDASEVTVRMNDRRELSATVVGIDRKSDVAVIKVDAQNLPTVTFGDPSRVKPGEWVVAIGSPFGLENSVTAGIVSAKGRSLPQETFVPFIQTDVAINPGNSGGPLFNLKGEVVGMNSMIFSRTGGFMGVSFAIPIDVAMDIANQLRATGRISRGRIGVVIQEVTKELAESFGLPKAGGALVNSVEKGGPADKAGIQASDVILKFDNKEIASSSELPRIVASTRPGAKVTVQVWRKGERKDLALTVGETADERGSKRSQSKKAPGDAAAKAGLMLSELSADQKHELNVAGGVLVENAEGAAARAGIRRGDVILALNNQEIKSVEELNRLLASSDKTRSVALLIKRGDASIYVPLRLGAN